MEAAMARQTFKDIPIEYNGRVQTLKQWVEELGLDYSVVTARYRHDKTPKTGLFAPTNRPVKGADLAEWLGSKLYERVLADATAQGIPPAVMARYYVVRGIEQ